MADVFPLPQTSFPYGASRATTGTLIAGVAGKKIVTTITAIAFEVTGYNPVLTITGTMNGATVNFLVAGVTGTIAAQVVSLSIPPNLEFDAGTSITVTIANTVWVNAGYYLK